MFFRKVKMVLGAIAARWWCLDKFNAGLLDRIAAQLFKPFEERGALLQKKFVLLTGPNAPGREWLMENHPLLRNAVAIDTRMITQALRVFYNFETNLDTVNYWAAIGIAERIREKFYLLAFEKGYALVDRSANARRADRIRRAGIAYQHGYQTATVWIKHESKTDERFKEPDSTEGTVTSFDVKTQQPATLRINFGCGCS